MVLPSNLNMRPAWRAAIEQQLKAVPGSGGKVYDLDVFKQFLVSDLRQSCEGSLPEGISRPSDSPRELRGAYVLQVEDWANIGVDEENRRRGMAPEVALDGDGASARRTIMLTLSDGAREISALEAEALPREVNLALKKYSIPGLKLVVKGGVVVRHGTILLTKDSVKILGGALIGRSVVNMTDSSAVPSVTGGAGGAGANDGGAGANGAGGNAGTGQRNSRRKGRNSGNSGNNSNTSSGGGASGGGVSSSSGNGGGGNINKAGASGDISSSSSNNITSSNNGDSTRHGSSINSDESQSSSRSVSRSHPTAHSDMSAQLLESSAPSIAQEPSEMGHSALRPASPSSAVSSSSPSLSSAKSQLSLHPPLCSSIREWLRLNCFPSSAPGTDNVMRQQVRVNAFVSALVKFNGPKLSVRLDDGMHLTTCTVSHCLHCNLLGLDPKSTSVAALQRVSTTKAAKTKVGLLLATYSGMFTLCHVRNGGNSALPDEIRIESFRPITPKDTEELKSYYLRMCRKRKISER